MKKFIKENALYILSLVLLIIIVISSSINYIKNEEKRIAYEKSKVDFCNTLDLNLEANKKYASYCESINDFDKKNDFFSTLAFGGLDGLRKNQLYIFLFIAVPTLAYICRYLKSKTIQDDLQNKDNKEMIHTILKKSYKYATIIPIVVLLAFIISYIYNGNFNYISEYVKCSWEESTMNHPYIFSTLFILRTVFYSIFYVNICLSIARKQHNFIISLILSYLTLFCIQIFFEVILALIPSIIFKSEFGLIFTAMGIIDYQDAFGVIYPFLFSIVIAIISTIIVYYLYKDKEKISIDCQKNN